MHRKVWGGNYDLYDLLGLCSFFNSFSVAQGHGNRAACLKGTSRKWSLELHFLQSILIRPQNSQSLPILQTLPTLIILAFLYAFFILFFMLWYHIRRMMAKQQPPKNCSSLLKVDCLQRTAEETTRQGHHHGQKNGKLSWLLHGC